MRLEDYLTKKGESPGQFADRIEVSKSAVNKWRRGERVPTPEIQNMICEETGGEVQPNDFILDAGNWKKYHKGQK